MMKNNGTTIRVAFLSLIVCGLIFPLIVTGLAQLLFPTQANGDLIKRNGQNVGSSLIAQTFTSPMFFHSRNDSASGVDPDITVDVAYLQIPRISSATGISSANLTNAVNQNIERTLFITGDEYVNVLNLNLFLISKYPKVYKDFT
ncbi:MAG TPA: potassium-transporting ATPase subunit C [Candidatus Acidoferrum sp.]|nr:potassium-transporting ATPase subunit C [Candidatus Acidoferrum sp.]